MQHVRETKAQEILPTAKRNLSKEKTVGRDGPEESILEPLETDRDRPLVNSCREELIAVHMFDMNSTASARLTKIAFLKLYNRLKVRRATDLLFQAYAERGITNPRHKPL